MENKLELEIEDIVTHENPFSVKLDYKNATDKLYTLFSDVCVKFAEWVEKESWQPDFLFQMTASLQEKFQYFITNIYNNGK